MMTNPSPNSTKLRPPSPSPSPRLSEPDSVMGFDPEAFSSQGHFVEQVACNANGGFSKISLPASIGTHVGDRSNLQMGIGLEAPSPKKGGVLASALPPLAPSLRRTVSDLSTSRTPSKASSCLHSSDSMRLRRMRDCLAEMGQWCNEVVREEERGIAFSEDDNNNTTANVSRADPEESVSVERVGEGITIQFKCPCGKGYQILISGNSCYYKLM